MVRTPLSAILSILAWEDLRLQPYVDAAGVTTWGWGHAKRKHEAAPPLAITRAEAIHYFLADLEEAERGVLSALGETGVTDQQLGALVSFAFNVGVGAFRSSTLLKKIKAGELDQVPAEFERWVFAGGRRLPGLVARRKAEIALWLGQI